MIQQACLGLCAMAGLAGCATGDGSLPSIDIESAAAVVPYSRHDRCVDLAVGDRLEYRWNATTPLAFELRYTSGGGVVAPISQAAQPSDAGIYTAVLAARYCATWEAPERGADLSYRMRVTRRTD